MVLTFALISFSEISSFRAISQSLMKFERQHEKKKKKKYGTSNML